MFVFFDHPDLRQLLNLSISYHENNSLIIFFKEIAWKG